MVLLLKFKIKEIKLYYDFEDNKYRYLIMEYCDGVNLLYLNKACLKMKETNPNYHIPEKIITFILFKFNLIQINKIII